MQKGAYYALIPPLKSQTIVTTEKINSCKTLIGPVATYGAESWTTNKDIAKQLATSERNVLRIMLGGIKVNEN